jgi:hypothetical protein
MAITYRETKRLIQPLLKRFRNTFRGSRDSAKENLFMHQMKIDLHRLDQSVDLLDDNLYENVRVFIGQVDPETVVIHEEYEDGRYYSFSDLLIEYYGDSATPTNLTIDTIPTISSKLDRIYRKIKFLENKKV